MRRSVQVSTIFFWHLAGYSRDSPRFCGSSWLLMFKLERPHFHFASFNYFFIHIFNQTRCCLFMTSILILKPCASFSNISQSSNFFHKFVKVRCTIKFLITLAVHIFAKQFFKIIFSPYSAALFSQCRS